MARRHNLGLCCFLLVFSYAAIASQNPVQLNCEQWLAPQTLHLPETQTLAWVEQEKLRAEQSWVQTEHATAIRKKLDQINYDGDQIDLFQHNGYTYEFRLSKTRPRGVLARQHSANPKNWEVVLDLEELSQVENESWSYQSATCFENRCLLALSREGKDQHVIREFDLKSKHFVEDGFYFPEGRNEILWKNSDSVYVVAEENSKNLTSSGNPRHLRLVKRHQPLSEGKILRSLKGPEQYHLLQDFSTANDEVLIDVICRDYYNCMTYVRFGNGRFHRLPLKANVLAQGAIGNHIIFKVEKTHIRKDGSLIPQGALIAWHRDAIASETLRYQIIWQPTDQQTLSEVHLSQNTLLLMVHESSQVSLERLILENGKVTAQQTYEAKGLPHLQITDVYNRKNSRWIYASDFIRSTNHFLLNDKLHAQAFQREFDFSDQYDVEQLWTTTSDHEPVPYLMIQKKNRDLTKPAPAIIDVYGGFDVPQAPQFAKDNIDLWVSQGGIYIFAMVHGSAERGWRANSKVKGPSNLGATDTIAVAEDLIARRLTDTHHIGLRGSSIAGRWIALAALMRPDLFKAVVCNSCILDLVNFTSWEFNQIYTSEIGDPREPDVRKQLMNLSPLHYPIQKDTKLPAFLLITSTSDDRVPPTHSRRFAQRLSEHNSEYYLLEQKEGGHFLNSHYQYEKNSTSADWSFMQNKLELKTN